MYRHKMNRMKMVEVPQDKNQNDNRTAAEIADVIVNVAVIQKAEKEPGKTRDWKRSRARAGHVDRRQRRVGRMDMSMQAAEEDSGEAVACWQQVFCSSPVRREFDETDVSSACKQSLVHL